MGLSAFFKSIVDAEIMPVVVCNTAHEIVYMNPSAAQRYAKRGGYALIGKSLLNCHNSDSNDKIERVLELFRERKDVSRVFTFHNPKENKDVYMIALRNDSGELIGYYEKHECRTLETEKPYGVFE